MNTMHKKLFSYSLAFTLVAANFMFASSASADNLNYYGGNVPATDADMLADAFLVRPVMLVGSVLGAATFVVTLPFSLLGGNVGEAGTALVAEPLKRTFVHPLGELD